MAKAPTNVELQGELATLRAQHEELLAAFTGRTVRHDPSVQADRVERGSDEHAAMLGLRKAISDDGDYVIEGWALEDITNFPPSVTPEYLKRMLRQKYNELTEPMPVMQSVDPRKPHFAPTMWRPDGTPFRQTTED